MTYVTNQIQLLCKAICRLRAGGRCEICGELGLHQHHIFFGKWKLDWRTFSNPDFYACLCTEHHLYAPEAPHVDNNTFLAIFLPKIEESRCEAIMGFERGNPGRPDYKQIRADLKQQLEELESVCWMDTDIET